MAKLDDELSGETQEKFAQRNYGKPLTLREQRVMDWVSHGKTNEEIGQILGISEYTVKNHLMRINIKLGTHNRAGAVGAYLRKKLARCGSVIPSSPDNGDCEPSA